MAPRGAILYFPADSGLISSCFLLSSGEGGGHRHQRTKSGSTCSSTHCLNDLNRYLPSLNLCFLIYNIESHNNASLGVEKQFNGLEHIFCMQESYVQSQALLV